MVKTLNVAFSACVLPCVVKITMILVIILSFSSVLLVINSANIDEITRDTIDQCGISTCDINFPDCMKPLNRRVVSQNI